MSTPLDAAQVRELIEKTRKICAQRTLLLGACPLTRRMSALADALESALGAVERVSALCDREESKATGFINYSSAERNDLTRDVRRALTGES